MSSLAFTLRTADGRPLYGLVDLPALPGPRPTVVCCHGFKGFMEWGFWPPFAHLLAERGFTVVRFNNSGSGQKPGDELVTDPAAFRANTYTKEGEDLAVILEALGQGIAPGRVDRERIGLVGHSRGGGGAVLAAAAERTGGSIRALVTWNAISRITRTSPADMERWREAGELPVENTRTHQQLALGPELLAEVESNPPALDILAAAARRTAPWLIVHGEQDEAVPLAEGQALAEAAAEPAVLQVIPGGGHTFGAKHPFAGPTRELIQVFNVTQSFVLRYVAS